MASNTFPAFAAFLGETLHIHPQYVGNVIRRLREAGELERGKSGGGAPSVTCEAAAKVLIALLMRENASKCPDLVRAYGALLNTGQVEDVPGSTFLESIAELLEFKKERPDEWPNDRPVDAIEIFPSYSAKHKLGPVATFVLTPTIMKPKRDVQTYFDLDSPIIRYARPGTFYIDNLTRLPGGAISKTALYLRDADA